MSGTRRDPRAVLLPAPAPRGSRPENPPRVAVIGGGIAGLAAATTLAERGARATVLERADGLGGRLRGWPISLRDGTTATMTRGFHAFFRQYYNLRALLARTDPELEALTPLPDYPLVHAAGPRDRFAGLPTAPPWNALALALRSPSFPPRELGEVNIAAALQLLDVDVPGIYRRLDHLSAADLLAMVRFPRSARHLAFEVFSRSFFADPWRLSAAELAVMFHIYFLGSSEGLVFDVPRSPFPQALWNPLARYLERHGVEIHTATPVDQVAPGARGGFTVRLSGGRARGFDAVVLATDAGGLRALVESSPGLATPAWRELVKRVPSAPPFLVSRLWLDRPVRPDRPGFLATAGYPTLDNVSVLERYEDQARTWSARTGGSVVELHAYALAQGCEERAERERLIGQMRRVYPETAEAGITDERHELRADCPLFPPGGFQERPPIRTPDPWLVVAGDHVRVDLPVALMERAATSGVLAANALLGRWGTRGHPVWSVPLRGRTALPRALARWVRRGRR